MIQKSWFGKGKSDLERSEDHVSQPLSSLQDPHSFGAPPKNVNYYGGRAEGSPSSVAGEAAGSTSPSSPAVLDQPRLRSNEEEESQPEYPQGPYRVDTTGLSTNNLPKPPIRRVDQEATNITNPQAAATRKTANPPLSAKPKPSLPPRLPPRQASPRRSLPRLEEPSGPPPSYDASTKGKQENTALGAPSPNASGLNQGAIDRLGKAGISVPGLGIGSEHSHTDANPVQTVQSSNPISSASANVSELQTRFAQMGSSTASSGVLATPLGPTKKPPLPPKKSAFHSSPTNGEHERPSGESSSAREPPPVPVGTKPK